MNHSTRRKSPKVVLDFIDWEITLRELIFAVLIVGVMTFIGFLIASYVEKKVNDDILVYRQAASITTNDEFSHAINTDIGHAFAVGELMAGEPVTNKHVSGEYLSIVVKHQEYRMHTSHYYVTGKNGKKQRKTRHYWTWDTMSVERNHSKTVNYCGVSFPYDKFSYVDIPENQTIYKHSSWSGKREVIYTMPRKFNATIFGNFIGRSLKGHPVLVRTSIDGYKNRLMTDHSVLIFWVCWIFVIVFTSFGFFILENKWLED